MPFIQHPRGWEIPEKHATAEGVYLSRRKFIQGMGAGMIGATTLGSYSLEAAAAEQKHYPAKRNTKYALDRNLTDEKTAGTYNNFYEFTTVKDQVKPLSRRFKTRPWTITVSGLVAKERTFDLDALLKRIPPEERLYRHRCVEAWSMAVPWTGIPLKAFVDLCEPKTDAKFVRFVSVNRPEEMPGIKSQPWYPWPYFEGLSMAEATNELAMLVTGIYGHALPNPHGAPVRIVTPWKYGYKSPKSIVRVEFVEQRPATFWNQLQPAEYSFESNVDPEIPHPRWSQARERLIDTGEWMATQKYNGYGEFVAGLYR